MEDRLEFRRSRVKGLGMFLLSAGFVALGWFMTSADDVVHRVVGWITLAFFGFSTLAILRELVIGGTRFTLTRSGIIADNVDGLIPWEEIASCGVLTIRGNRMLSITFRDPERFLVRSSAAGRKVALLNESLGWGHWTFSFAGVDPGIGEALAYIRTNVPRVEITAE